MSSTHPPTLSAAADERDADAARVPDSVEVDAALVDNVLATLRGLQWPFAHHGGGVLGPAMAPAWRPVAADLGRHRHGGRTGVDGVAALSCTAGDAGQRGRARALRAPPALAVGPLRRAVGLLGADLCRQPGRLGGADGQLADPGLHRRALHRRAGTAPAQPDGLHQQLCRGAGGVLRGGAGPAAPGGEDQRPHAGAAAGLLVRAGAHRAHAARGVPARHDAAAPQRAADRFAAGAQCRPAAGAGRAAALSGRGHARHPPAGARTAAVRRHAAAGPGPGGRPGAAHRQVQRRRQQPVRQPVRPGAAGLGPPAPGAAAGVPARTADRHGGAGPPRHARQGAAAAPADQPRAAVRQRDNGPRDDAAHPGQPGGQCHPLHRSGRRAAGAARHAVGAAAGGVGHRRRHRAARAGAGVPGILQIRPAHGHAGRLRPGPDRGAAACAADRLQRQRALAVRPRIGVAHRAATRPVAAAQRGADRHRQGAASYQKRSNRRDRATAPAPAPTSAVRPDRQAQRVLGDSPRVLHAAQWAHAGSSAPTAKPAPREPIRRTHRDKEPTWPTT